MSDQDESAPLSPILKRLFALVVIMAGAGVTALMTMDGATITGLICAAITLGILAGIFTDDD